MFHISLDPARLNSNQRRAIAAFLIDFPSDTQAEDDEESEHIAVMNSFPVYQDEIEDQTPEDPTPEQVFSSTVPTPQAEMTTAVDKNGLPWDARIHASSRATNADGTWRYKRGVDKLLAAQVEKELRELMAIPAPVPSNVVMLPVPAPPAPVAVPAPPVADAKLSFVNLIETASKAIASGKLTHDQLNAAAIAAGVPNISMLGNRLDLVPQVEATLNTFLAAAS